MHDQMDKEDSPQTMKRSASASPCLMDREVVSANQETVALESALTSQPLSGEKQVDKQLQQELQQAASQDDEQPVECLLELSLAAAGRASQTTPDSATEAKPWHNPKLGPHRDHSGSWPVHANAPHVRRRQHNFKVFKTLKKPGAKVIKPALQSPALISNQPKRGTSLDQSHSVPDEGNLVMADVDDRRDYRRSGGGGGGRYAGQKRRFREDDEQDRRPQRRFERPEYPSHRARRLVWSIADNPIRNAAEDVVDIAKLLADNAEDQIFCDRVSNDIILLVQEQPFKIPFAAAIVLHVNQQKPSFVQMIIARATARIQTVLEAGEWRTFKLLLRFLGCMQPIFEGEGCFTLLDELFNRAADLQSASSEDTLGLELVKIIMLTIPYILASTGSNFAQQALELLSKTDIIASAPREVEGLAHSYISMDGNEARQTPSVIGLLQKQLQTEAENEWPLTFIPHLFKSAPAVDGEEPASHEKYPFPAITVPQVLNPGSKTHFPELYFSVYADQDIETVPPTSHLAASLLRDALVDTIGLLDFNRNAVAKFLVDLDCYWAPETFVRRATPFDKIKDVPESKTTWKSEDLAVDAIFSQMLQLPTPEHKMVFYHAMITETCKIAPGAIAPSLGRAIRFLYTNIDTVDVELSHRFMDWFSHHLSNFDFQWKWKEWIGDVKLSNLYPRKAFILGSLDKEIRLSFAKRIRQTLPEEYQPLIPSSQDNDIPEFKYNNELTPYSQETKQLVRLLRKKAPDTEIESLLSSIASASRDPDTASDANVDSTPTEDSLPVVDAFATTICYIGSKSLSHVLSHIERQKERLTMFSAAGPAVQAQIISSVVAYWRDVQAGVAVNIIDKLLNYTILTPQSVVEWALDPTRVQGGRFLATAWVYEMVEGTVQKVTTRMRQIVAARSQRGLPAVQIDVLEKALQDEADGMRALFATIEDALAPIAEGAADAILEGDADMEGVDHSEEDRALCRLWGGKWRRVFARKLRVEEMVLAEMSKSFPPPAEEDPIVAANGFGEGDINGGAGDGDGGVNGGGDADGDVELDIS